LDEVWQKKAGRRGPRGEIIRIRYCKSDEVYACGDVALPLADGGQGVPGDGVIPGDELVLP